MDWNAIGRWAANNGPLVSIVIAQWGIIWRLLNRFFAQQEMVMRAISLADRSTKVAEKTAK